MIRKFGEKYPKISKFAIVDENALIIGDVFIDDFANIWPHALLRATDEKIFIGKKSAVLDKSFIESPEEVRVGEGSIISHGAIIHGSKIGKNVLVGIGAIVLEAEIGDNCIIASGSVVKEDAEKNSFVAGVPGKVIREVTIEEIEKNKRICEEMYNKAKLLNEHD
ncbi:MAG: gamma carbonic anhydrase family protein [Thermoplasmatales archaeon]|nr:gamma carbonic anhydrase family protein [Thermoplasmatales archaeon]